MTVLFFAITLQSCDKEQAEFTDWPIIESYLNPGEYPKVKISRQIPFSSNVSYSNDDINNLNIQISQLGHTAQMKTTGDGYYIDSSTVVTEGVEYSITFSFNNKLVYAYTKVPTKPAGFTQSATTISIEKMDESSGPPTMGSMPDPIQLTWTNTDESYYLVVIENMEDDPTAIFDFGDKTPPGHRFRKSPVNAAGLEINSREFNYYGHHRIILYHVLPDYAALYNQGSTSSQNLTNPSTSINNGYGIFTGLNSDTLYIDVIEAK